MVRRIVGEGLPLPRRRRPRGRHICLPTILSSSRISTYPAPMAHSHEKETTGAWIVHHGRKLDLHSSGPPEFPAIDQAAKAATLLAKLGQSDQISVPYSQVRAIATASGLNPGYELAGLLEVLKEKRLIDRSGNGVEILGITNRAALVHATDIFGDASPDAEEFASIRLAEMSSKAPVTTRAAAEQIGDEYQLDTSRTRQFFSRAKEIGFVDSEGSGDDELLFNGNLFRRNARRSFHVLQSLTEDDQSRLRAIENALSQDGCLPLGRVQRALGKALLEKLVAAGVYDLNTVSNAAGNHVYVTAPSAFHKFVDPFVDDCFDMAKSLVAALFYGMTRRPKPQGRIDHLPALLSHLIAGREVGPATAIGEDYRVLEANRVVGLRQHRGSALFFMRLLKREVGQLALHVLQQGDAGAEALTELPAAPMAGYTGPEEGRTSVRRKQTVMSKRKTRDILEVLRSGP